MSDTDRAREAIRKLLDAVDRSLAAAREVKRAKADLYRAAERRQQPERYQRPKGGDRGR